MMTPERFRILVARREGTSLDFKRDFYPNTPAGNAELAKDIAAMANALGGGDEPAAILIGVEELVPQGVGNVTGFVPQAWMNDATLQQKVASLLNRLPTFSWSILTVDGKDVGAFEIFPGSRPFYALKDAGILKRHQAVVRVGSATDIASPDQVIEWAERDRNLAYKRLESEKLEAEQMVRGRLSNDGFSNHDSMCERNLLLHNDGVATFLPAGEAECAWSVDEDQLFALLTQRHARLVRPVQAVIDRVRTTTEAVRPEKPVRIFLRWSQEEVLALLRRVVRDRVDGMVDGDDFTALLLESSYCDVRIRCENTTGARHQVVSSRFGWNPTRSFVAK